MPIILICRIKTPGQTVKSRTCRNTDGLPQDSMIRICQTTGSQNGTWEHPDSLVLSPVICCCRFMMSMEISGVRRRYNRTAPNSLLQAAKRRSTSTWWVVTMKGLAGLKRWITPKPSSSLKVILLPIPYRRPWNGPVVRHSIQAISYRLQNCCMTSIPTNHCYRRWWRSAPGRLNGKTPGGKSAGSCWSVNGVAVFPVFCTQWTDITKTQRF